MLSDMLTPRGVNIRNNKKASVSFVRRYGNWRFSIFGLTNAFMHESTFLSWIASANIHIFFDTAPSGDKVSSKYKEIRVIFPPFSCIASRKCVIIWEISYFLWNDIGCGMILLWIWINDFCMPWPRNRIRRSTIRFFRLAIRLAMAI